MEKKEFYVDANGGQEFTKIAEALEAAHHFSDMEIVIHIAPGTYKECLVINQEHISFIGIDENETKITYSYGALDIMPEGDKRGTFRTPSVFIDADRFYACHISFFNEAGVDFKVGQALAMYADGDHLVFENCRFDSYQDTLFTAPLPKKEMKAGGFKGPKEFAPRRIGRHLYKKCYIAGNVDFIFGSAIAYFEDCEVFMKDRMHNPAADTASAFILKKPSGYVTAPSTYEGQNYGYVFKNCRFTSDCPAQSAYLGRPWRNFAKCVIIDSEIGAHIRKEGWHDWDKKEAWETIFFAEYGNYGAGADTSERAPFVKILTKEQAAEYTRENVLGF